MRVKLLHSTPLEVCSQAIRTCWDSNNKSDTHKKACCRICSSTNIESLKDSNYLFQCNTCGNESDSLEYRVITGEKDKALIDKVGNKFKHNSTLEMLQYHFDIQNISTSCLLELTRHRTFSYAVQSTRYTTKKRKDDLSVSYSHNNSINIAIDKIMNIVKEEIEKGVDNDDLKLLLPQAYNYSLVLRCDARNLQNFLALRTNKQAHYHIRELAYNIYEALPDEHKYLFKEFVNKN